MASRVQKVEYLARWLYRRIYAEREVWNPDDFPPGERPPWRSLDPVVQDSYRQEAQKLLAGLEGPGVGGTPHRPAPGR